MAVSALYKLKLIHGESNYLRWKTSNNSNLVCNSEIANRKYFIPHQRNGFLQSQKLYKLNRSYHPLTCLGYSRWKRIHSALQFLIESFHCFTLFHTVSGIIDNHNVPSA